MADGSKSGGRKSPVDRSDSAAEFPSTVVKNVDKGEHLETKEQRPSIGKSGKGGGYGK
tara:strand:+ start:423 stop:596 length:174 start_codon:yes stop_codon:yes gene_type:complete